MNKIEKLEMLYNEQFCSNCFRKLLDCPKDDDITFNGNICEDWMGDKEMSKFVDEVMGKINKNIKRG